MIQVKVDLRLNESGSCMNIGGLLADHMRFAWITDSGLFDQNELELKITLCEELLDFLAVVTGSSKHGLE